MMTKSEKKAWRMAADGLNLLIAYREASRRYDDCTVSGDAAGMKAAAEDFRMVEEEMLDRLGDLQAQKAV